MSDYYRQMMRIIAEELNVKKVTMGKLIYTLDTDTLELRGYKLVF